MTQVLLTNCWSVELHLLVQTTVSDWWFLFRCSRLLLYLSLDHWIIYLTSNHSSTSHNLKLSRKGIRPNYRLLPLTFQGKSVVHDINSSLYYVLLMLSLKKLYWWYSQVFRRWGNNIVLRIVLHNEWLLTEMQLPAVSDTLVTHSAHAIPETLFYSKIPQGATALISHFPSGIQTKGKVNNVKEATKWNTKHFKSVMSHRFRHPPDLCYKYACVFQKDKNDDTVLTE